MDNSTSQFDEHSQQPPQKVVREHIPTSIIVSNAFTKLGRVLGSCFISSSEPNITHIKD